MVSCQHRHGNARSYGRLTTAFGAAWEDAARHTRTFFAQSRKPSIAILISAKRHSTWLHHETPIVLVRTRTIFGTESTSHCWNDCIHFEGTVSTILDCQALN